MPIDDVGTELKTIIVGLDAVRRIIYYTPKVEKSTNKQRCTAGRRR